ncbi:homogentisate 1,2-dioxygenase [Vibrio rhizosphaerae]|uniref:Homogentisate 1,2-dioxygenase n=1 Tax=Vibrio rhizosphaerae TaxID=398736 RepID=A0ABU4IX91_9VIBR|nr:YqaJ viral recombinase family protein [Vibrio rhizosphaerae]MDW6094021.1 homogentisate 1,2-dioxygenase [Vibrio rhizosphaerae]
MKTLDLVQGSQEWLEARLNYYCASEAPAVMGESKYMSRSQLLDLKKGWQSNPVSSFTQKLFDDGHEHEDMARDILELEELEDYPPVVGLEVVDGIEMLASFDGFGDAGAWEHKDWNKTLAENVRNALLEPHYYWQLEHQCIVGGLNEVQFTCSDGTENNRVSMIYQSVPERRDQLIAAWKQFDKDLEKHELKAKAVPVTAENIQELPPVTYKMNGLALASNFEEFKSRADSLIEQSQSPLETDQDFANAENMVKVFKSAEEKIGIISQEVLGEVESIDTFVKDLGLISENIRQARLTLDKQVKKRKEEIKSSLIAKAKADLDTLLGDASLEYNVAFSVLADFSAAIKGKRNIESIRGAIDDELAKAKVTLLELKDVVQKNHNSLNQHPEYRFLFNDWASIAFKPKDDFETLVKLRITEHKEAEEKRLKAERERIEHEAKEKAKSEAVDQAMHDIQPQVKSRLSVAREVVNTIQSSPVADFKPKAVETITISVDKYRDLQNKADLLDALFAAGVDSWDGYGEAIEMLKAS